MLIGPPGAGKTVVGQVLAKDLDWQFWDTDAIIEQATAMKVADIFSKHSEDTFRFLEKTVVERIGELYANIDNFNYNGKVGTVISCGGGLPIPKKNFAALSELGTIVHLYASPNILIERIKQTKNRPLLDQESTKNDVENISNHFGLRQAKLEALIQERKHVYAQARLNIDTSNKNIITVARSIKEQLGLGEFARTR